MSIKIGNKNISKIYLGTKEIKKVYLGSNLIWENTPPIPNDKYLIEYTTTSNSTLQYVELDKGVSLDPLGTILKNWISSRKSILKTLKISTTNTITNCGSAFYYCTALTSLDLTNFDTSSVTNMYRMFYECSALTSLDLTNFDTSSVTTMLRMFSSCAVLTSLDLSNFDTSSVTDMQEMFYYCRALTTIYCNDNWYRSGVSSNYMFDYCTKIVGAVPYSSLYTNLTMANPDTGYFTYKT